MYVPLTTFHVRYLEAAARGFPSIAPFLNRYSDDLCHESFGEPTNLRVLDNCRG